MDGALLLELFTRDGGPWGTMISGDFYEGIRQASLADLSSIQTMLQPLMKEGIILERSAEELGQDIDGNTFYVLERESRVLACVKMMVIGPA